MVNKLNGYSKGVSFGFIYLTWLFNLNPCFLFTASMEISIYNVRYESNPVLPIISPFYILFQDALAQTYWGTCFSETLCFSESSKSVVSY